MNKRLENLGRLYYIPSLVGTAIIDFEQLWVWQVPCVKSGLVLKTYLSAVNLNLTGFGLRVRSGPNLENRTMSVKKSDK